MEIAAVVGAIIKIGVDVAPRIVAFFNDLHKNDVPTQEQIDDVWARHQAAYKSIMDEDPSTHPGG